jgi:hypothetical protein
MSHHIKTILILLTCLYFERPPPVSAFFPPVFRIARTRSTSKYSSLHLHGNGASGQEDTNTVEANDPGEGSELAASYERDLDEEMQVRWDSQFTDAREPSYLEAAVNGVLDRIFVRRRDANRLRKMFVTKRSYARLETFAISKLDEPPMVDDLLPYPTPIQDSFYLSVPSAILTFVVTSAIFPFLANFLVDFVHIPSENLQDINSKLVPGVSILYGTFMSLTLSILYNRQRQVQDSVAQETSLLSFLLHNMCFLFKRDRGRMVRAGQCAADQVRILLRENRGVEYMSVIYTDPYIGMLTLVEEEEERLHEEHGNFMSNGVSEGDAW